MSELRKPMKFNFSNISGKLNNNEKLEKADMSRLLKEAIYHSIDTETFLNNKEKNVAKAAINLVIEILK